MKNEKDRVLMEELEYDIKTNSETPFEKCPDDARDEELQKQIGRDNHECGKEDREEK